MEVKARHFYNADVEAVFACFGTAEKVKTKLEALGARNVDIRRCELSGASLEIDIHREVPAEVPSMMKKFMSDWNEVHQTETWTGNAGENYLGKFTVAIHGLPAKIHGVCDLHTYENGAINEVTVTVECGIPLVGKKVEKFIAESIEESMEKEYQVIKDLV